MCDLAPWILEGSWAPGVGDVPPILGAPWGGSCALNPRGPLGWVICLGSVALSGVGEVCLGTSGSTGVEDIPQILKASWGGRDASDPRDPLGWEVDLRSSGSLGWEICASNQWGFLWWELCLGSSGGPVMGEVPQLLGILWGGRFI